VIGHPLIANRGIRGSTQVGMKVQDISMACQDPKMAAKKGTTFNVRLGPRKIFSMTKYAGKMSKKTTNFPVLSSLSKMLLRCTASKADMGD